MYQSVQEAIDWADPNVEEEVWVAKGVYLEIINTPYSLYGGFAGTETDRGARDWQTNTTILDGHYSPTVVNAGYPAIVDGFTIRNGYAPYKTGADVGGVILSGATLSNCIVTQNSSARTSGVFMFGGARVINCAIIRNTSSASAGNPGGAVEIDSGTVAGSVIAFNRSSGRGGGITTAYATGGVINLVNNTIVRNKASLGGAIAIISQSEDQSLKISNNLVAFNTSGFDRNAGPAVPMPVFHNNCIFGNGAEYHGLPSPIGQDGNISVEPQLANWPAGDFHLLSGSPCINAGNTADVAAIPGFELDMDGQPRVMGSAVDIGADEAVVSGFTTYDARYAMRAALGGLRVSSLMAERMDVETGAGSTGKVDLLDSVRLMRKAAGLEVNP